MVEILSKSLKLIQTVGTVPLLLQSLALRKISRMLVQKIRCREMGIETGKPGGRLL